MAPKYETLRKMTDEEVIEQYDAAATNASGGIAWWADELARRQSDRQTVALVALTRQLTILTWVVVALTLVTAGCAVAALVIGAS